MSPHAINWDHFLKGVIAKKCPLMPEAGTNFRGASLQNGIGRYEEYMVNGAIRQRKDFGKRAFASLHNVSQFPVFSRNYLSLIYIFLCIFPLK